jgi:hypothetical protein
MEGIIEEEEIPTGNSGLTHIVTDVEMMSFFKSTTMKSSYGDVVIKQISIGSKLRLVLHR